MLTVSCIDGVSLGPGHCQVIAQPFLAETTDEDLPPSVLVEWSQERGMSALAVDCPLTRLAVLAAAPEPRVFACGRLGYVAHIRDGTFIEETIDGPQDQGFIRDLRARSADASTPPAWEGKRIVAWTRAGGFVVTPAYCILPTMSLRFGASTRSTV